MIKVGIVGYSDELVLVTEVLKYYKFQVTAIYNPMFSIDHSVNGTRVLYVSCINDLIEKVDVVIVSSGRKIYFPWIEECLRASKPMFLESVFQFSDDEIAMLVKLKDEANVPVQVRHAFIHTNTFQELFAKERQTLLYDSSKTGILANDLLSAMREEVSAALLTIDSNIRKVQVNAMCSLSDIPDILNVRLDFDNGSFAKLHVNSVEKRPEHKLKVYKYNSYVFADLSSNCLEYYSNDNKDVSDFNGEYMDESGLVLTQLHEFCNNILNQTAPIHGIDNENRVQLVVNKVKQKIRLNFSVG